MQRTSDHILGVPRISYYIALLDFGPRIGLGPSRLSATPEATRRQIVEEVADHIASDRCVVHVRHIVGTDMEDITHEIIEEALAALEAPEATPLAASFDHARDLRKHEAA